MSKPTDPWEDQSWWRAALAGEKPPVHESDPHPGWYKFRRTKHKFHSGIKDDPWTPVVVWRTGPTDEEGELTDDEKLFCKIGNKIVDDKMFMYRWTWFCQTPITPEEYQKLIAGPALTDPEDPGPTSHPEPKQSLADADFVF